MAMIDELQAHVAELEEQLAQARAFRSLADNAADAVFLGTSEGKVAYANRAAYDMFGYDHAREELTGIEIVAVTPEADRERVRQEILPTAMSKGSWRGELKQLRKDDSVFDVYITVFSIYDATGQPLALAAIMRDITMDKQAQETLCESESRFKGLVTNLPGAVYQFKLNAAGQRSFPYVSAKWLELLGVPPEEAQRDPTSSFAAIIPEDLPEVERTIGVSATTMEPWRCEFRTTVDGEVKVVYGSSTPEQQADGSILWNGVLMDITAQKEADAARERLQQQVLEAQQQVIQELSTPIIPLMQGIIVMPLVGVIDTMRARETTRTLLAGISEYRAKVVILDITGVPVVDSGIAAHLDKTIQAARLKGARVIITGISDAVAEAIVDLGIDWRGIETRRDLQTGLLVALSSMKLKLVSSE